jgi:DNA-binding response OmpR family regulator
LEGPVLVVDDDRALREVIVTSLVLEGHLVSQASNGAEALRLIQEQRPCLVLLDMQMPLLDGWGLAAELKTRGLEPQIIVMTAGRDAERVAQEVGAAGFMGKPFDLTDLLTKVEAFLVA